MEIRDRFAVNLRRAREAKAVSQEELGFTCDLHRTEISLLERGGREPRLGTLLKLSQALDVGPEELCAGIVSFFGPERFDALAHLIEHWRGHEVRKHDVAKFVQLSAICGAKHSLNIGETWAVLKAGWFPDGGGGPSNTLKASFRAVSRNGIECPGGP